MRWSYTPWHKWYNYIIPTFMYSYYEYTSTTVTEYYVYFWLRYRIERVANKDKL